MSEQLVMNSDVNVTLEPTKVNPPANPESPKESATLAPGLVSPEQPAFIVPDKFKGKSAEDIAKAYVELEKYQQKKIQEAIDKAKAAEKPIEPPKIEKQPEIKSEQPPAPAFDVKAQIKAITEELQRTGTLSEESMKIATENLGIDPAYIAQQKLIAEHAKNEYKSRVAEGAGIKPEHVEDTIKYINNKFAAMPDVIKDYQLLMNRGHFDFLKKYAEEMLDVTAEAGRRGSMGTSSDAFGYQSEKEWLADVKKAGSNKADQAKVKAKFERSYWPGKNKQTKE